jgi:hypothetical protein
VVTLLAVVATSAVAGMTIAFLLASRGLRRWTPWPRRIGVVLVAVAVTLAGVFGWARLMVDRSGIARSMVWLEADTGDWRRFPARPIEAGPQELRLRSCSESASVLQRQVRTGEGRVRLADLVESTETTSFLVLRDRCLLVEDYSPGTSATAVQTSFSMAKSFLSTLVGIAVARGDIESLDDPLTTYVPELRVRDARFERITLRHLITMSSGLRYVEQGLPWSDDALTYYSPDLRRTALSAEVDQVPGRAWLYNNYNPLLMGLVLERATGERVADYMEEHLWQPMAAGEDASWSLDSNRSGFEKMESGINAVPRDYARFGYLFAHGGRVNGRAVVPEAWVREATAADATGDPNAGYQHWWWVDRARPGRFYAKGNFGQFIYVDPKTDVVVVRTGTDFGIPDWPSVLRQVADRVDAEAPQQHAR